MKVDLHLHAMERSRCARNSEEEMICAAIEFGLDGIAFTDHHKFMSLKRLQELNENYAPFRIFRGIEISVLEGEDIVVFGVYSPKLESNNWHYNDLHDFIREKGGFMALVHPFRHRDHIGVDFENLPTDAIEIQSLNTGACDRDNILSLINRLGIYPFSNSDAHNIRNVGIFYNKLDRFPENEIDFLTILKDGEYQCRKMQSRVACQNAFIEKREKLIKQFIAEGRDRDEFQRETGIWARYYDRVSKGRSSII